VKKGGFVDWTRTLNVTGGSVHLSADLEAAPAAQAPAPQQIAPPQPATPQVTPTPQ
jgi:hypothetical protein